MHRRTGIAGWTVWQLTPWLRWHVTGVVVAATAAIGTVAALTSWRARDVLLFGLLACFGAIAIEFTRRTPDTAGLIKEVHAIWQLPMAFLLPPVYCLLAPAITIGQLQMRTRRTIAHRRVFTAAANGLSLGAASIIFHALPGLESRPALWLLATAGCALAWLAVNKSLVMTAVWLSDRTVSVREQQFSREPLLTDGCEIAAAVVITGVMTWAPLILLVPALPGVIVLQRFFRQAQLLSQARVDAMTGLLHPGAWRAEAEVRLDRARHTGSSVALLIADLDRFQSVTSQYGWQAGDNVIAATAGLFRAGFRSGDLIGRLGGKEFVCLLPGVDAGEAVRVAERLRATLATQPIPAGLPGGERDDAQSGAACAADDGDREPGCEVLHVTVSIGIAAAADPASCDLADLLTAADAALFQAKQAGRDRVCLAAGGTDEAGTDNDAGLAGEQDADGERAARDQIAADRRELGEMFEACLRRAGLTHEQLAGRIAYTRSSVSAARAGRPMGAAFWAAADPAVGADGRLVARHTRIEAASAALRQQATRQARRARRRAAEPGTIDALPQDGSVAVANAACPNCGVQLDFAVTSRVIVLNSAIRPSGQ